MSLTKKTIIKAKPQIKIIRHAGFSIPKKTARKKKFWLKEEITSKD